MEYLKAGYGCAGSLRIQDCKNLRVVNCEVGGDLRVSHSPLERTGGGMQVGGDLYVMGNGGDLEVRGRVGVGVGVGGRSLHAGVELPVGGLPRPNPALKNSSNQSVDKAHL